MGPVSALGDDVPVHALLTVLLTALLIALRISAHRTGLTEVTAAVPGLPHQIRIPRLRSLSTTNIHDESITIETSVVVLAPLIVLILFRALLALRVLPLLLIMLG